MNLFIKMPFNVLEEGQFLIKTMYGILIIFTVLHLLETKRLQVHSILLGGIIAASIIGVSFWLAIFTDTSNLSYRYMKAGYTGWFFSANELGVILLVLLALVLVAYERKVHPIYAIFSLTLLLSVMPMLGTKVPLYGGFIILGTYVFWSLIALFSSKHRQWKSAVIFLLLIVYGTMLPFTPAAKNTMHYTVTDPIQKDTEQLSMKQQMLSSRDVYFNETKKAFLEASPIRKLFGIGYGGDYETTPKMVEMDGYDLLSSYGLIGFLAYVGMLFLLAVRIVRIAFGKSYVILIVTCFICVGISFAAGHILFAPAVMSYLFFLIFMHRNFGEKTAFRRGGSK